jgi:hypothetical protein
MKKKKYKIKLLRDLYDCYGNIVAKAGYIIEVWDKDAELRGYVQYSNGFGYPIEELYFGKDCELL